MKRVWAAVAVLLGAACAGGGSDESQPEAEAGPPPSAAPATALGARCEEAFLAAANNVELGEAAAEGLEPTLQECGSVAEWKLAAEKYPNALAGGDPDEFLRDRCSAGATGALCDEMRGQDGAQ